ncbi:MAG: beta-N-acetylhexosaminidase [Acidobacteriaceae bacterium]
MLKRVWSVCGWSVLLGMALTAGSAMGLTGQYEFRNDLMPEPAHLQVGEGHLLVQPGMTATVAKFDNARLDAAIHRAMEHLKEQTGVMVATKAAHGASADSAIVVSVDGPGEAVQGVHENESYQLDVTGQGIHLHAATVVGAMRGLETLLQLVQNDGTQYFFPAVRIEDQPLYPWRGLMLDCSRHFVPVPKIRQIIRGMAAVKLNVLHWHLSDDQGFRMQSKVFPLLTKMGSNGEFYTQGEAREIVAYARARGIRVVPEFDMPGHTSSWMVGYPELASAKGPFHIQDRFGVFDPVMDPTRASTYRFLDQFIGEMVTIFPDAYFHIGGDENNGVEWRHNARIQAFMRAHHLKGTSGLQAYFNRRVLKILTKYHKRMIGWDEVLTPGLPESVTIQSWRGYKSLAKAAREGHDGILSSGYYLDHMSPASAYYAVNPIPPDSTLTAVQRKHILGGEACMWNEYVDGKTIDSRIWPRAAAVAERLWSPENVTDVNDMYRRLRVESVRLEALGLTQISQEWASLRMMAGTEEIGPLRVLAAAMQPVSWGARAHYASEHKITTHAPLDHWVDALRPDPPLRHDFAVMVDGYLKAPRADRAGEIALTDLFASWVKAEPGALELMQHSPLLAEAKARPGQLAQLGRVGVAALGYLSSGETAPAGWKAEQLAAIAAAREPVALTEFAVLGPLERLVEAVPEGGGAAEK